MLNVAEHEGGPSQIHPEVVDDNNNDSLKALQPHCVIVDDYKVPFDIKRVDGT